jgi:endonuclease/exonuclease/phosphatase family metal-dependent hydrolase
MFRSCPAVALLAFTLVACTGEPTPTGMAPTMSAAAVSDHFEVFTQNVYVGADVDRVLAAPPEQLQQRLFEALATFAATDWPGRATTIAATIARRRPAVVALNEITALEVSGLAPFFPDMQVPFLPVLMAALANAGAEYVVAGVVDNIDVSLNLGGPAIRLRDADAILVRADLHVSNVTSGNYAARVTIPLGPVGSVDLVRGWVAADVTSEGRSIRVFATHLEPKSTSPLLQLGQVQELLSLVAGVEGPVIIAGDINSDPSDPDAVTPYRLLLGAGFEDSWLANGGTSGQPGFTCCHAPTLDEGVGAFDERIDHILVRRAEGAGGPLRPVHPEIIGDELAELGSNGLWASDHAGLYVRFGWNGLLR